MPAAPCHCRMINTISRAVNSDCFIGSHLDNEDSIFLAVLCCISLPSARRTVVARLASRYRRATNNRDLLGEKKSECGESGREKPRGRERKKLQIYFTDIKRGKKNTHTKTTLIIMNGLLTPQHIRLSCAKLKSVVARVRLNSSNLSPRVYNLQIAARCRLCQKQPASSIQNPRDRCQPSMNYQIAQVVIL